jgi:hypothetical protein
MSDEKRRQALRESNRLATCAAPLCGRPFAVCGPCDRGRRYCSPDCCVSARRARQRQATRLYQSSDRGRLAHAARQARYRERARGVTHRCSDDGRLGTLEDRRGQRCRPARAPRLPKAPSRSAVTPKPAGPCCAPALVAPDAASAQQWLQRGLLEKPPACAFCRRAGRFLRHGPRRLRPRRRHRPSRA